MKKNVKIKQRDITDCGAACLASIAAHYKLQLPISRIRQYAGTDKRGTNILGLTIASEQLGFQAKGAKGTIESLSKIPLPAIAHVVLKKGLQHYVVIYEVGKKYITYMDPADGQFNKVTFEAFKEIWSGVIVLVLPGETFQSGSYKVSNRLRFWQLIMPHRQLMIQAFIGTLLYTILGLSTSIYVQKIIDFVLVEGNLKLLNLLSVGMIVILFFQILIGMFKTTFSLQMGQHIDARLILGYYKHLLKLPQRFFDTMRIGEITSRINDAVKIRLFINDIAINIVLNLLIVSFSITIMFLYYWKLALLTLSILPVYLFLYWLSNYLNKKRQRTIMEQSADLEAQLVESLNAIGTVKRFRLEEYVNYKTENRFIVLLKTIYRTSIQSLYISSANDFFTKLITIIVLWAGSYFVINRELSPGELLSFYALIGYFANPLASLVNTTKNIQEAMIAADRLFEIIDLEIESSDLNKVNLTPDMIDDIKFNNVHFRYGTRTNVFNGLDFTIKKGQSTAIVGESGSGKSTLLSLLQNLYPLNEGNITIGGFDIQHISNDSIRTVISVVPQNIELFAGTVIENIALGDREPNMQLILGLSNVLGINEFIEKLPNTYGAILNEQGINLSGGQRQRLAIARALYRNPSILILDEATSSLDPESEKKVQNALSIFKKQGKTIIVIAHRLSTVKTCDTIAVFSNGKLVEAGNHNELIATDGFYKKMWLTHTLQV